ncbi:MAG: tyrosine/phenylalanine carboxypeptidase domain-containing protein [Candidatus Gracilibacteria bacterium]
MKFFSSKGILGINARNLLYIKPYNPKKAIRLADNKIKTKKFLEARGIPVPKLIAAINNRDEAENFDFNALPNAFVVKPNCGFGGEGIIPIANKREKYWVTSSGNKIDQKFLFEHIIDILDGRFSISNVSDVAFFEQLLIPHESVSPYTYEGLPDIRIIVYNLVPVMAMLRLPTKESGGKANLHQGAVGIGIDMGTGRTTFIAKKNKIIDEIPDIGKINLQIPFWDEMLHIASKIQMVTNLGYLAVDIALDKNSGPVLLEINARAGLGVQIANLAPLRRRLERVQGIKVTSPEQGVRLAKDMFGKVIEKKPQQISNKKVIGKIETVEIILKKGTQKIKALVDSTQERSAIDQRLAEDLDLLDSQNYNDEQSTLKIKFSLKDKRIQTVADIEKIPEENEFKMIIGSRDLQDFLIDPSHKESGKFIPKRARSKKITNNFEIDQEIVNIDNKLKLLFHLRPVNLEEEKRKFLENFSYNPQFVYPELKFNPTELKQKLETIRTDESPLGIIFEAKRDELMKKIELIESIDTEYFTQKSANLFGKPDPELIKECEKLLLEGGKFQNLGEEDIDAEEAKERFEKVFKKYKLQNWKVKIQDEMVTDCVAGKNNRLLLRKNARFSEKRIENLIIHEIETHILTAENGKIQPYEIFNRGLADYLITQEGLAIYNVTTQSKTTIRDSYKALALVIAANTALNSSFVETFEKILSYGIPIEQALRIALKTKRGLSDTGVKGAFTKDIIYYKGFKEVSKYIEEGGRIADLYIGKLNVRDIDLVQKIEGLAKPKYLPEWLR